MGAANVIRELFVRLGVKYDSKDKNAVKEFDKAIDQVKGQMEDLAGIAVTTGKVLVGTLLAAAAAAGALVVTSGQEAQNIERQARALNLTRKEYQEFQHVFGTFGADSKEISEAFLQLTEKTTDLVAGSKTVAEEFALIGLRAVDLKGKRPNEIFETVADAMARTTDRQKALGAASKLLGEDTAKKLLPALVQGAAGIRALRAEAERLGVIMDDRRLARLKAAGEAWNRFKTVAKGLRNAVAGALAPVVTKLLDKVTEWIAKNRELIALRLEQFVNRVSRAIEELAAWVDRVGGWGVIFLNLATGVGIITLLANLKRVQEVLGAIRVAIIAIEVVAAPAAAAIGLPLGVIVAGLAALVAGLVLAGLAVDDYLTYWRGGESVLGANLDLLESMVPGFGALRDLFGALVTLALQWASNIGMVKDAVLTGLAPAFQVLDKILESVGRVLAAIWKDIDRIVSAPLERATNWVRGMTGVSFAAGTIAASQVQSQVSGAVARGLAAPGGAAGGTDNSVRSATLNATIHSAGPMDVQESFQGAFRAAGLSLQGRPR